ncbi:threonine aldolase [Sphaerisporangium siamense]|uniref:Threonine aldolase n=1 Tax=Sphaerisporangium siamense TaxID=795645 RepID=A0A7W7D5W1_9ACTN|nr:beta-eliminating lyase-related protein [Sphaerisporangium siamense]MBB4699905.1 threonine aldolase [Sphaerisporangium siamense]GII84776.1 threonine aldolase [Sphaerisporangium siamense]
MIETLHPKSFASDNHAGAHPSVVAAAVAANEGDAPAYGDDRWTDVLSGQIRAEFGDAAASLVVLNGTGANMLSLSLLLGRRYEAVICPDTAHIATHETGAAERVLGVKLITVPTPDGKLTPGDVTARLGGRGNISEVQPSVVSISQVTELGTCYTPDEVAALARTAHDHGMTLHMDGARLANAAAFLGCPLRALTTDAGVDVVSFGASKNGAMVGEAVIVLRPELAEAGPFLRRQTLQLASKMRFVSAQISALLTDGLWRRNADQANAMARRLADGVADLPGLAIRWPVESNAVFASLPAAAIDELRARFAFHVWDEGTGTVRWMTAFDTTPEDVDTFVTAIRQVLKS